jgi:hypothetical protein
VTRQQRLDPEMNTPSTAHLGAHSTLECAFCGLRRDERRDRKQNLR